MEFLRARVVAIPIRIVETNPAPGGGSHGDAPISCPRIVDFGIPVFSQQIPQPRDDSRPEADGIGISRKDLVAGEVITHRFSRRTPGRRLSPSACLWTSPSLPSIRQG